MQAPRLQIDVHLLRNVTKRLTYVGPPQLFQFDSSLGAVPPTKLLRTGQESFYSLSSFLSFTQTRAGQSTCASRNICKGKHTQKRHV